MIVLLNLLVPVAIVAGLFFTWKLKKVWPIILAIVLAFGYTFVQPSYMPKGKVKPLPVAEFTPSEKKTEDRMRKPVSAEERDAKRVESQKETTDRINALQKELKENK